ncbi:lipopolysaccharide biosynthesis protein [Phyllobacterium leguminum]|uniref:O-antigen/teichoic acid export membrane protein n=1 Tax=Phyllobacterium leguminum TaxID=314237 RepID=A0A318T6X6_9HYPH|nr:lipopolysaccharide biosynthesis protein [Phyllobacterium leguminum]PYE90341.1 O-antigen/teichoic acid export membrane protein [Phyllobacterium leguminum]
MLIPQLKQHAGIFRDYFSAISGSVGRLVVSLAYFIALANTLSIGDFGVFATASATGVVLSRLVSFGFVSPLYRISTVKPQLIGAYTGGYLAAIALSLPFLAAAALAIHALFFGNDIDLGSFALIIAAEALFWRSTEAIIIVNNGLNRFGRAAFLVIFGTVARAIAAVLFAFSAKTDLAHWSWWYFLANGISLLVALRFYPRVRLRFAPALYIRHIADALAVAGAEMLFYVQTEMDKLLVLSIGGPRIAGIYAILMRLMDLTALPIRSFNMMLVQRMMRTPDMLRSLKIRAGLEGGVFLISTIALAALALFLHFFPNALGDKMAAIVILLPLTILVPGFRNLTEYQAELLYARGQSTLRTFNLAVLTAAKGLLIWLLFTHLGADDAWVIWLNGVYAALYLLSLALTSHGMRQPATRV